MPEILQSRLSERVLHLTLNRPEKRNALNGELCRAIADAVEAADADPDVSAILVTANGKSFCAGMDLDETGGPEGTALNDLHDRLFTLGSRVCTPMIAAVNGAALGGGTGLVANFHIVLASVDATFGLTEIRLGLWPFLIYRAMTAALGERRTVELALTGRVFGAAEGRELGLVHEVCPDVGTRAMEVARTLAGFSSVAIRKGLAFVQDARGRTGSEAAEIAREARDQVFQGEDFQEGVRAFREKRRPKWPSLG